MRQARRCTSKPRWRSTQRPCGLRVQYCWGEVKVRFIVLCIIRHMQLKAGLCDQKACKTSKA